MDTDFRYLDIGSLKFNVGYFYWNRTRIFTDKNGFIEFVIRYSIFDILTSSLGIEQGRSGPSFDGFKGFAGF
jgi:hypothetical protein